MKLFHALESGGALVKLDPALPAVLVGWETQSPVPVYWLEEQWSCPRSIFQCCSHSLARNVGMIVATKQVAALP